MGLERAIPFQPTSCFSLALLLWQRRCAESCRKGNAAGLRCPALLTERTPKITLSFDTGTVADVPSRQRRRTATPAPRSPPHNLVGCLAGAPARASHSSVVLLSRSWLRRGICRRARGAAPRRQRCRIQPRHARHIQNPHSSAGPRTARRFLSYILVLMIEILAPLRESYRRKPLQVKGVMIAPSQIAVPPEYQHGMECLPARGHRL